MSSNNTELEDGTPSYALLRTFATYAVFALLIWMTVSSITNSHNTIATIIGLAAFWVAGLWLYRRRSFIAGWMRSGEPMKDYSRQVKEKRAELQKAKAEPIAGRSREQKSYDYSAADNEHLQPLSVSERREFQNLMRNLDIKNN